MPTLIASDGYEYADFAHRVAGFPLENFRNQKVVSLRYHRNPEGYVRAWYEGWDDLNYADHPGVRLGVREFAAYESARAWARAYPEYAADVYGQPSRASRAGVTNPVPAPAAAVHSAN